MKLQDRLLALAEYGVGFNMHDGNVLVNITYKDSWSVIQPSDETITFMCDDKRPNTYYYSAPLTTDMAHIFETIDETVAYNLEMEAKVVLFKAKVEEMQELFVNTPLNVLKTLKFQVEEPKTSAKKTKKTAKKKEKTGSTTVKAKKKPSVEEKTETSDIDTMIQTALKEKEESVLTDTAL